MKQQLERVDRMTEPLVAGRHYLVWTVHGQWQHMLRDWPVVGPRHNDKEFFNFSAEHYHIDSRFLPLKAKYRGDTLMYPLHAHEARSWSNAPAVPLGEPMLRKRKCVKAEIEVIIPWQRKTDVLFEMHAHYAGQQCASGKAGWICPHRKASLGNVQPIDGVITCPLHLLKIDAETGVVLPIQS